MAHWQFVDLPQKWRCALGCYEVRPPRIDPWNIMTPRENDKKYWGYPNIDISWYLDPIMIPILKKTYPHLALHLAIPFTINCDSQRVVPSLSFERWVKLSQLSHLFYCWLRRVTQKSSSSWIQPLTMAIGTVGLSTKNGHVPFLS